MRLALTTFLKKHWLTFLAIVLIGVPLLYLYRPLEAIYIATRPITHHDPSLVTPTKRSVPLSAPVRLSITRVGFEVTVKQGAYNPSNQSWVLDSDHAFYIRADQTPLQGQTWPLIYGHYRTGVFRPLSHAKPGDILEVTTEDGQHFYYSFLGDAIVNPNQGDILNSAPTGNGLQLLTCEGVFFEKRRILYFGLIGIVDANQQGTTI